MWVQHRRPGETEVTLKNGEPSEKLLWNGLKKKAGGQSRIGGGTLRKKHADFADEEIKRGQMLGLGNSLVGVKNHFLGWQERSEGVSQGKGGRGRG